jgi:hypothetical protein
MLMTASDEYLSCLRERSRPFIFKAAKVTLNVPDVEFKIAP